MVGKQPGLAFKARERAYRLYRERGDRRSAARVATWIGADYFDFRGEAAIANGWRQRAHRLLDGLEPTSERGWLALHEGDFAILMEDDTVNAKRKGREAAEVGHALEGL